MRHIIILKKKEKKKRICFPPICLHLFCFLLPPSLGAAYETNYEELKVQKGESWLYHAKRFEEFLRGKEYVLGSEISWTDFLLFETMDFQRVFVPGSLDAFPNLKAFSARVAALPQVPLNPFSLPVLSTWLCLPLFFIKCPKSQ